MKNSIEELLQKLKDLLPLLHKSEMEADYDPDLGGPEKPKEDPASKSFEALWFQVNSLVEELKSQGIEPRLVQHNTECTEAYDDTVEGMTRREFFIGDHLIFEWEEYIWGELPSHGSGFCLENNPIDPPPHSLIQRLGFTLEHPGFPETYHEAIQWAGLKDDEDDSGEDENDEDDEDEAQDENE
jgi:hypothetical protein